MNHDRRTAHRRPPPRPMLPPAPLSTSGAGPAARGRWQQVRAARGSQLHPVGGEGGGERRAGPGRGRGGDPLAAFPLRSLTRTLFHSGQRLELGDGRGPWGLSGSRWVLVPAFGTGHSVPGSSCPAWRWVNEEAIRALVPLGRLASVGLPV